MAAPFDAVGHKIEHTQYEYVTPDASDQVTVSCIKGHAVVRCKRPGRHIAYVPSQFAARIAPLVDKSRNSGIGAAGYAASCLYRT